MFMGLAALRDHTHVNDMLVRVQGAVKNHVWVHGLNAAGSVLMALT